MIKRNAKIDVSHGDTICWKHRENYGCKFRIRSSKCMYPGHVETKGKPTVKPMSLPVGLQPERMFTNPAVKVILFLLAHHGSLIAWFEYIIFLNGKTIQNKWEIYAKPITKTILVLQGTTILLSYIIFTYILIYILILTLSFK